jgi:hypothetical protein
MQSELRIPNFSSSSSNVGTTGGSGRDVIETPLVLPDIFPTDEDLCGYR